MRRSGVRISEAAPRFWLVFRRCAPRARTFVRGVLCGCMKELQSFLSRVELFAPVQLSNKLWLPLVAVNVFSVVSQGVFNVCCFW